MTALWALPSEKGLTQGPKSTGAVHVQAVGLPGKSAAADMEAGCSPGTPEERRQPDQTTAEEQMGMGRGGAEGECAAASRAEEAAAEASPAAAAAGSGAPCGASLRQRAYQERTGDASASATQSGQPVGCDHQAESCGPGQGQRHESRGVPCPPSSSGPVCPREPTGQQTSARQGCLNHQAGVRSSATSEGDQGLMRVGQGGCARIGSRSSFVVCSEGSSVSLGRPQRSRSSVIFAESESGGGAQSNSNSNPNSG